VVDPGVLSSSTTGGQLRGFWKQWTLGELVLAWSLGVVFLPLLGYVLVDGGSSYKDSHFLNLQIST
jgi:hypothetical protein